MVAKSGPEIFGFRGPACGDRDLNAGARRPSHAPGLRGVYRTRRCRSDHGNASHLPARDLIEGPGEASRSIEHETVEHIAGAGTDGSGINHRLAIGHLAGEGRVYELDAAHREGNRYVRIGERRIGFPTEQQVRLEDAIISALHAGEVTARSAHEIEIEGKGE